MSDWLLWPADLLLAVGGAVAGFFISKDSTNFAVVQMMAAALVLATIVALIVLLQSLLRDWWSRKASQ